MGHRVLIEDGKTVIELDKSIPDNIKRPSDIKSRLVNYMATLNEESWREDAKFIPVIFILALLVNIMIINIMPNPKNSGKLYMSDKPISPSSGHLTDRITSYRAGRYAGENN